MVYSPSAAICAALFAFLDLRFASFLAIGLDDMPLHPPDCIPVATQVQGKSVFISLLCIVVTVAGILDEQIYGSCIIGQVVLVPEQESIDLIHQRPQH